MGAFGGAVILLRSTGGSPDQAIAVFGVGLIGSALVDRLRSLRELDASFLPLGWHDPAERDRQLEEIRRRLAGPAGSGERARRTFVWSAGRAGFSAGREDAESELANFRAVLALYARCREDLPKAETRFVHFSSAGGLFEGQRHVDSKSVPRPRRPYGELKEAQEKLLLSARIPALVVRLSSVYGCPRPGQRAGLVSTLLFNGIRREVSSIFGSSDTLRDFVWVGDVAEFVARLVTSGFDPAETRTILLASGRPSSIFEVQKIIEDLLGYKIYVSHSPVASNRDDITFSRSALPRDWSPGDLRANVGAVYRDAMRTGSALRHRALPGS